jgi:lipoic acid synthetase
MRNRLPFWFKQSLPDARVKYILSLLKELNVNTICVSGKCPNLNSCFKEKNLTFLILGDTCSRNCNFCAVKKSNFPNTDIKDEPLRIKEIVKILNLDFVVITSVCRDDLEDKGISIFEEVVREIKGISQNIKIELLIPDFGKDKELINCIANLGVEVIGHNIEVPFRLYPIIKPKGDYRTSLEVLRMIKKINPKVVTKSSLILGLGEKEEEVIETIRDLREVGLDILTLSQYLSPSERHYPVKEFLSLDKFNYYKEMALKEGIPQVFSGPLVRSSYRAKELYFQFLKKNYG